MFKFTNSLLRFFFHLLTVTQFLITSHYSVIGCTDLRLTAPSDQMSIVSRTMEFAIDMPTKITFWPKKQSLTTRSPDGRESLKWVNQYEYFHLTSINDQYGVDGINSEGLSFGVLWFPDASYPHILAKDYSKSINTLDIGHYTLGQFKTVEEVKKRIEGLHFWVAFAPEIGLHPPLHLVFHDANNHSLVVEFINGQMKIMENPNGVLTNSPSLDWQLGNLRNYLPLTRLNSHNREISPSVHISSLGEGSGLFGLPGDYSSPSRFIRTTILSSLSTRPQSEKEAINLAQHLMNNVDIPHGTIKGLIKNQVLYNHTQWAVIKDLKNKILYYRTYKDLNLKNISLSNWQKKGLKRATIVTQI